MFPKSGYRTMLGPSPHHLRASITLLLCLLNLSVGHFGGNPMATSGGALGMCYLLLEVTQARGPTRQTNQIIPGASEIATPLPCPLATPSNTDDPLQKIIRQSRYTILLMRSVAEKLNEEQFNLARIAFQQGMALVPGGDVEVGGGSSCGVKDSSETAAPHSLAGCLLHVEPFFLDRCLITNGQYYEFVAGGGYHEIALWDKLIWPAVLDMVDQTGLPGPRLWKNGCYLSGEEDLPVVGISWYEAAACAHWQCKRLPTEAEWVKAASWPVPIDAKTLVQRRYPWGDAMDRACANVWGSGPDRIVAVREFAEGVSVGGVHQLIGNVWEWIDGDFQDRSGDGKLELPTSMKSIRGGAFDTYFDSQANTQFQSGENPLSRRHNIGFRCAISMRDVLLTRPTSDAPTPCTDQMIAKQEE